MGRMCGLDGRHSPSRQQSFPQAQWFNTLAGGGEALVECKWQV